jgi:hypothetical protein
MYQKTQWNRMTAMLSLIRRFVMTSCRSMSALGHKQTYAPQNIMSALPPIATAKADIKALAEITKFLAGNIKTE